METESRQSPEELIEHAPSPASSWNHGTTKHWQGLLLGIVLIGLVLLAGTAWWYVKAQSASFRMVIRGSRGESDGFGISGGNLVIVPSEPGVVFGTVKKPWSAEEVTYLVLFTLPPTTPENTSREFRFDSPSDRQKAETKDIIKMNGKGIESVYRIELNEPRNAVASESLTINGKSVDLAFGRLFLVDLTAEQPTIQQKKVELPAIPSKLESPQDIEKFAEFIRTSLQGRDPGITPSLQ